MAGVPKVILLKKETVEGTDSVPTTAANACVTRNFSAPKPIQVDQLDRNLDLPSRGRVKSQPSNRRSPFSYELELAGSGTAGTAAAWMEHLELCGFAAPTLTALTKAEQKAVASGRGSSGTCHHWMGEQRVRVRGTRGSFGLNFMAGRYPFLKFDMLGIPAADPAVDNTAPSGTPDFTRWKAPLEVNTENTDFTLDGFAAILKEFSIDLNANVKRRQLVGADYIQRGDHAMTGRIVVEAPLIASKNYFSSLDQGAEVATQIIHGTVAGNIVQVDAGFVQILDIDRSEEDDVLMLSLSVGLNIRAGQDDLLFTAK